MSSPVYSCVYCHFVWSTKNRESLITSEIKPSLYNFIGSVMTRRKWQLIAIGGVEDHIHILMKKISRDHESDIVCRIKSNSSRFMSENFVKDFTWQHGYSVFTVDQRSIDRVKGYILNQELHHKKMSFEEEYIALLKRNCIKYNAKYISKRQFFE